MGSTQLFRYTTMACGKKLMIQPGRGSWWSVAFGRTDLGSFPEAYLAAAAAAEHAQKKHAVTEDDAKQIADLTAWNKTPFINASTRPGR